MGGSRAAIRYAKAVLSLAQDQKTTDVVNNDMKLIAKTIAENIELSDVLNSPVVSPSIKKSALLEIFKGINPLTANAIDTLMSNKRIALLPEVAKQYSVLFDKLTGTELATVTTALPLTEDLKVKVLAKVKELTGKEAGILLNEMGITLNRNAIPFDTRSPFVTSGIRMGTPAVTTCGMKEEQLTTVGLLISDILKNRNDENQLSNLKAQVRDLAITHQPYA